MTRNRRVGVALAVPAIFVLVACAGHEGAGTPAQPTAIATWSEPLGVAPELVYVTDIEGFELVTQSVGVMGDDGMSGIYVRSSGDASSDVMLTTSRDIAPDVVPCAGLPDSSEPAPELRCATELGDVHVTLDGVDVDPATLRAAAQAIRVPRADELDDLFAGAAIAEAPVERGDLPPVGDGAPLDSTGVGG